MIKLELHLREDCVIFIYNYIIVSNGILMEYCKINTLFMRDENNVIIPEEYTEDIFGALENCLWECTEKIDGTNMRVELVKEADGWKMAFGGRTDRAVIPRCSWQGCMSCSMV